MSSLHCCWIQWIYLLCRYLLYVVVGVYNSSTQDKCLQVEYYLELSTVHVAQHRFKALNGCKEQHGFRELDGCIEQHRFKELSGCIEQHRFRELRWCTEQYPFRELSWCIEQYRMRELSGCICRTVSY